MTLFKNVSEDIKSLRYVVYSCAPFLTLVNGSNSEYGTNFRNCDHTAASKNEHSNCNSETRIPRLLPDINNFGSSITVEKIKSKISHPKPMFSDLY